MMCAALGAGGHTYTHTQTEQHVGSSRCHGISHSLLPFSMSHTTVQRMMKSLASSDHCDMWQSVLC